MNSIKKQKGMTMIGMVLFFSLLGFIAYAGIRLLPIYNEYYSVVKAMKVVANSPGASSKTPIEIKRHLIKNFDTSYVERVESKHIKVVRNRGKQLQVKYDVIEPFIGNLDFLLHFEKTVPLK